MPAVSIDTCNDVSGGKIELPHRPAKRFSHEISDMERERIKNRSHGARQQGTTGLPAGRAVVIGPDRLQSRLLPGGIGGLPDQPRERKNQAQRAWTLGVFEPIEYPIEPDRGCDGGAKLRELPCQLQI